MSPLPPGVINTHNVPPDMFEASTYLIVVGGVLIIAELLILLFIFEAAKKRISSPLANGAIYNRRNGWMAE